MVNKELYKMITNHQRTQTMNLILITLKMPTWLLLVLNSENLMANGLILMMSMSTHLFLNLELIQKLLKLPLLEVRDLSHGLSMILKDTDQLRSFLSLIQRLLRLTLLSMLKLSQHQIETQTGPHIA